MELLLSQLHKSTHSAPMVDPVSTPTSHHAASPALGCNSPNKRCLSCMLASCQFPFASELKKLGSVTPQVPVRSLLAQPVCQDTNKIIKYHGAEHRGRRIEANHILLLKEDPGGILLLKNIYPAPQLFLFLLASQRQYSL